MGEFKKASPQEKIFIVGGGLAALAIALYIRSQSSASGAGSPAQGATGASLTGGGTSGGGIQTVPGAGTGQVPILPPGLQPIFDNAGNLLGYQPITQSTPVTPASPPASPWNPIIPASSNFSYKEYGQQYVNGQLYTVGGGSQGRVYGVPGSVDKATFEKTPIALGQKIVLYQNQANPPVKMGGGPYGTAVLGVHGKRMAPTREGYTQPSHVARVYAMRQSKG